MSHQALEEFLAESEELLEKLNRDLAVLGESADAGQENPDLVNGIFRDAHSLKGLAGMFGFNDIAELSHHLENLLDNLRLGKIDLTGALWTACLILLRDWPAWSVANPEILTLPGIFPPIWPGLNIS